MEHKGVRWTGEREYEEERSSRTEFEGTYGREVGSWGRQEGPGGTCRMYLPTYYRTCREEYGGEGSLFETCTIEEMTGEVEEGKGGGGESRLERRIKISGGEGGREEKRASPSAPSSFDTFET